MAKNLSQNRGRDVQPAPNSGQAPPPEQDAGTGSQNLSQSRGRNVQPAPNSGRPPLPEEGSGATSKYRHLELISSGPVSRVRLADRWPAYHEQDIRELVAEWNSVVDVTDCQTLFMDCSKVKVLSSELLSKLIVLQKRLKEKQGKLILCGVRTEVHEVLNWTKLDQFFEIQEDAQREVVKFA